MISYFIGICYLHILLSCQKNKIHPPPANTAKNPDLKSITMWLSFSIFQFCSRFFFTLASMSIRIKNWCKKNTYPHKTMQKNNSQKNPLLIVFSIILWKKVSWNIFTDLYTYCLNFSARKKKTAQNTTDFYMIFCAINFCVSI